MRLTHRLLALWLSLPLSPAGFATAQGSSQSAVVTHLQESLVFNDAQVDGRPLRTYVVRSAETAEAALVRIVDGWAGSTASPTVQASSGGWRIASRLTQHGWETVQMRSDATGSTGFRTLWRHVSGPVPSPRPDWLPESAKLLHAVASRDGERHGTTVVAVIPAAPVVTVRELTNELTARGWRKDRVLADRLNAAMAAYRLGDRAVVLMRRAHEELVLSIASAPGGTGVTAHHTQDYR